MKKLSSALLVLFIFTTSAIGIWAIDEKDIVFKKPTYKSFTGRILDIKESGYSDENKLLSIEAINGSTANLLITKNTYISEGTELNIGETITGYFDAIKPTTTIYPTQYSVEVIISENESENYNIHIGYFDENLISFENLLKLNLSKETNLLNEYNDYFSGDISFRKLIVYYNSTTRSIPAQTTPEKIIVLEINNNETYK